MGIALSFLSGKGGSGKTTFSISIADLLSTSTIKTLLVDCDIGTNGASYFFANQMADWSSSQSFTSFFDIIKGVPPEKGIGTIKIQEKMYFMPSVPNFQQAPDTDEIDWHSDELAERIRAFIDWAKDTYEIVLFDCQSGYTGLFPLLLPCMDEYLFLLEIDAISTLAMRNLYLRIGKYLGGSTFQSFNKVSEYDYAIYSKIDATLFLNIGTVLFDWRIRQAFSRRKMPKIDNTSHGFVSDLLDICRTLFPQPRFADRFNWMEIELERKKLEEEEKETEQKLLSKSGERTQTTLKLGILYLSVLSSVLTLYLLYRYFTFFKTIVPSASDSAFAGAIFFLCLVSFSAVIVVLTSIINPEARKRLFDNRMLRKKLTDINQRIPELKEKQKTIMRKIEKEQSTDTFDT